MNIYWDRPDTDFHKLFAMAPETDVEFVNAGQTAPDEEDTELDFDADDDFEFSLDD